jgi:hypothetical protein
MALPPNVKTLIDNRAKMNDALEMLRQTRLMVGIPAENAGRKDGPASNAVIGYVMENGDADKNIPPRPFLNPGVESQRGEITSSLKAAGQAALQGDQNAIKRIYGRLGLLLVTAVRTKIDDQGFTPLAPRTVKQRLEKLGKTAMKQLNADLRSGAVTMESIASGVTGYIKILLDTGSMRNAITYVIRRKGRDIG